MAKYDKMQIHFILAKQNKNYCNIQQELIFIVSKFTQTILYGLEREIEKIKNVH